MTHLFVLDQNLLPKLIDRLADLFPASSHVQFEGLDRADADFNHMSLLRGTLPNIIWLVLEKRHDGSKRGSPSGPLRGY